MKLFKRLLLAPAALGMFSPLVANASEVNLIDVSNYSEEFEISSTTFDNLSTESKLIAGGEGMVDTYDGGFSETTTASFSADFELTTEDGGSEALQAYYGFQIDLNTSFTGEDSLDVSLDGGNGGGSEFDLNSTSDNLQVDGVSYTFPVGPATVFVGDNTDGSALYNTACVYGGPSNNLDDCGNGNSAMASGAGTAAGASYDIGGGFAVAVGYTGAGSSTSGLATKESADVFGGQLSYTGDSYGASITYANTEDYSGTHDRNFTGVNAYWAPDTTGSVPSISAGYEVGNADGLADTTQWFIGAQWDEAGPGTFGVAAGTQGASLGDKYDPEYLMYEAFYSYDINDGMTITPLIYVKETAASADDKTGVMVKTSFSF